MGKVYSPPKALQVPRFDDCGRDFHAYDQAQAKFVESVKTWAKTNSRGEFSGEEVFFPHADGYARYVVLSLKPVVLIHLPVGDAWQYPYIERLLAKDIIARIRSDKSLAEAFAPAGQTG